MRIDSLTHGNAQTQGGQRRELLRQHSPKHLEHSSRLMLRALHERQAGASPAALILGAGACTEVPLAALTRAADEVVLVDLDLASLQQARNELSSPALRKRVGLLQADVSGRVSANLNALLAKQPWSRLVLQGARAVFDAAAACLEQCDIADPPELGGVEAGGYGLVISSFVLSQLFSYPLLDILDRIQRIAPDLLGEQERHARYQQAAQDFRRRVIEAHLHLLRTVTDRGGAIALLSDVRGFVFEVYGTDHDAEHRRSIPLVPRTFPEMVQANFSVKEEAEWEWITDVPENGRLGRGYEVVGYVLI